MPGSYIGALGMRWRGYGKYTILHKEWSLVSQRKMGSNKIYMSKTERCLKILMVVRAVF